MTFGMTAFAAQPKGGDVTLPADNFTDTTITTTEEEVTVPTLQKPTENEPSDTQTEPSASEPTDEEPTEEPPEEATDEDLIAQYRIPDTWSRPALLFAVRNEILFGTDDGTLSPTKKATRSELAAILSRVLKTEHSADLSVYTDINPEKWYCESIAHAAALGLISGTSADKMSPNSNATREQAITMLARAFGLKQNDTAAIYCFKDWQKVSSWAAPAMAAMIDAGCVSGTDGNLNPKSNITRQEFAQIVYCMIDRMTDTLPAESEGTTVTANADIPAGTVVHGDLLICSDAVQISLENLTVNGRLIMQGADTLQLKLNGCGIGTLVLCRPTEVELLQSETDILAIADTVIHGTANLVTMMGGAVTVAQDGTVNKIAAGEQAKNTLLTVDGTVKETVLDTIVRLEGSGTVEMAAAWDLTFDPVLLPTWVYFNEDYRISQLNAAVKVASPPSKANPTKTLTLTFSGKFPLDTCDIDWYENGRYVCTDTNVSLSATNKLSHSITFTGDYNKYYFPITIVVHYRGQSRGYALQIPVWKANLLFEVSDVKTLDIISTVNYTTAVYSDMRLTNKIGSVNYGTKVYYRAYWDNITAKIQLPNGTTGWVPYGAISIGWGNYYTTKDYTQEVKEAWVNKQGYSSDTDYLIWCNLYTQRVNIFKGSKGNWKLVFCSQCASGKNSTPTPLEVTKILYKSNKWDFGSYYVHHVSVFDSSRGFHSMLYNYSSYTLYDGTMGKPASHGCVRMPDKGVQYIWDNCPVNTTVVIY